MRASVNQANGHGCMGESCARVPLQDSFNNNMRLFIRPSSKHDNSCMYERMTRVVQPNDAAMCVLLRPSFLPFFCVAIAG